MLAHAARKDGVHVTLFFMSAGVMALPPMHDLIESLRADGCELIACAASVEKHHLVPDDLAMALGSQDDHAAIVHKADRVLAFT